MWAGRVPRRYKQSVPKQIKGKEEHRQKMHLVTFFTVFFSHSIVFMSFRSSAHRRAPVHKKNVLSFAVLSLVNCVTRDSDVLDRLMLRGKYDRLKNKLGVKNLFKGSEHQKQPRKWFEKRLS